MYLWENNKNSIIALLTDFGYDDIYAGVVKGVIKDLNPGADIIDISHSINSYSVQNAQFSLYSSYNFFPPGTIFYIVVDPGVGTGRRGLIAKDDKYFYILPDNGIISAVSSDKLEVYSINESIFSKASNTFHGRDIFAPVAAYLSIGKGPGCFGEKIDNYIEKKFPDYTRIDNSIICIALHIDKFGNVITSIPNKIIKNLNLINFNISLKSQIYKTSICKTYANLDDDNIGIIEGSSGFIELALNKAPVSMKLQLYIGDEIVISYE